MPAQANLAVWRGNTTTREFIFQTAPGVALDLTGSTLVFVADAADGTTLRKNLTVTDALAGKAQLDLTLAEGRSFVLGVRSTKFEIERRVSTKQETLVFGWVNVSEWANRDD